MTPTMPKHIQVIRRGAASWVEIDGKEFPWYIAEKGIEVSISGTDMPTVTLTLFADRVNVENVLEVPKEKESEA